LSLDGPPSLNQAYPGDDRGRRRRDSWRMAPGPVTRTAPNCDDREGSAATHLTGEPMATKLRLAKPPEVDLKKELLAREIGRILRDRQMTQTEASYLIREQPSQLSLITNGRLRGFSLDRLVKYLARLGCDVEVRIAPRKGGRAGAGKVSVQVR